MGYGKQFAKNDKYVDYDKLEKDFKENNYFVCEDKGIHIAFVTAVALALILGIIYIVLNIEQKLDIVARVLMNVLGYATILIALFTFIYSYVCIKVKNICKDEIKYYALMVYLSKNDNKKCQKAMKVLIDKNKMLHFPTLVFIIGQSNLYRKSIEDILKENKIKTKTGMIETKSYFERRYNNSNNFGFLGLSFYLFLFNFCLLIFNNNITTVTIMLSIVLSGMTYCMIYYIVRIFTVFIMPLTKKSYYDKIVKKLSEILATDNEFFD